MFFHFNNGFPKGSSSNNSFVNWVVGVPGSNTLVEWVLDMSYMFYGAESFNSELDNTYFNTKNVVNMNYMFFNTPNFTQDPSQWIIIKPSNPEYKNFTSIKFAGGSAYLGHQLNRDKQPKFPSHNN